MEVLFIAIYTVFKYINYKICVILPLHESKLILFREHNKINWRLSNVVAYLQFLPIARTKKRRKSNFIKRMKISGYICILLNHTRDFCHFIVSLNGINNKINIISVSLCRDFYIAKFNPKYSIITATLRLKPSLLPPQRKDTLSK